MTFGALACVGVCGVTEVGRDGGGGGSGGVRAAPVDEQLSGGAVRELSVDDEAAGCLLPSRLNTSLTIASTSSSTAGTVSNFDEPTE